MIKVILAPEPSSFNDKVRIPGTLFLKSRSNKKELGAFWQKALIDVNKAYKSLCAYTGSRIHCDQTIDHFLPKSLYPEHAYEWKNYRLCHARINQYKNNSIEILDPFEVEDGWFQLDFPSCLIFANPDLHVDIRNKINRTIDKLHLNKNESMIDFRLNIVLSYINNDLTIEYLDQYYPFVSKEIKRQKLTYSIRNVFFPN